MKFVPRKLIVAIALSCLSIANYATQSRHVLSDKVCEGKYVNSDHVKMP